jgi:hypothetical protein
LINYEEAKRLQREMKKLMEPISKKIDYLSREKPRAYPQKIQKLEELRDTYSPTFFTR